MRLIFQTQKFVWDFEMAWTKNLSKEEASDHDSDLSTQTHVVPDESFSEDSVVPRAKRVKGFVPND